MIDSIVIMMESRPEVLNIDMAGVGYAESYIRPALHLAVRKAIIKYGENHSHTPISNSAAWVIERNCFVIRTANRNNSTLWSIKCDYDRLDWELGL